MRDGEGREGEVAEGGKKKEAKIKVSVVIIHSMRAISNISRKSFTYLM